MASEADINSTKIESACRHHWVIEPAKGPVSKGECQMCHGVREFKNSIEWRYGQFKPSGPASS